ncbi:hypothetical protein NLJ89_g2624 [Agrocybe chaxingu]|uniref:Extracellular metalloproteinase n=1 Tax=Agrocybe chaxingu TaxID=84603 RepID=A0A9W8KC30_9AGAR|nr:hypothetical protein NLJ89_g2624 [Agrocybe chaxingu]
MALRKSLLSSIFLAVLYATTAESLPSSKSSTHGVRSLENGVDVESYHPPSTFEAFGSGIDHPLSKRQRFDIKDAAKAFICSRLSVRPAAVSFKSGYTGDKTHYTYLKQMHAMANVAFNQKNQVVAFGSSFVKPTSIALSTPSISLQQAITTAEQALNGKYTGATATLEYFVKPDHSVVLTHVLQVRNEPENTWAEAFVDAHTDELVAITKSLQKQYVVLPTQKQVLTEGFETLTDPQDLLASPLGWHATLNASFTTTAGNNAIAFKTSQSSVTSESSSPLNFIYAHDPTASPTTQGNLDAARTNAFYVVNTMHDFLYRQTAYNFQQNNFGLGGSENDRVEISVQASGVNNAAFSAPADGAPGFMRMYLWDLTTPNRDGSLENDIIAHEMTHGLTNRMTGGGTSRCLQTIEAFGLGEGMRKFQGWSDAMANWMAKTSSAVPDFVLGQYVTDVPSGIRNYPYSTSPITNPLRYSNLQAYTAANIYDIGSVWANMLHNVYAVLVIAHGWSATARTNPSGTEGNIVFLHLFIDALALQPCNPTFLTARSAWIQADVNRYGGINKCLLWNAFASRGLGMHAVDHVDDSTVPVDC